MTTTFCPPLSQSIAALERQLVVAEVYRWLGTPFQHAARLRGIGVDCIQFVAAVYEAAGAVRPEPIAPYTPDWYLHVVEPLLVQGLERRCVPVPAELADPFHYEPAPGDIVTFRFGRHVSHAGVVVRRGLMIHVLSRSTVQLATFGENDPFGGRYAGAWIPRRWVGV